MIVLFLLASAGLFISLYFILVYYHLLAPDSPIVPPFCRMDKGACAGIVHHRTASLLGVPNAALGMVYYALVMIYSLSGGRAWLATVLRMAAWFSVAVSVYLTYNLRTQLKTSCPLCLTAHALNVLIALMLTPLRESFFP